MFRKPLTLITFLLLVIAGYSQELPLSNIRVKKWIAPKAGALSLDSLSLIPNSEIVSGTPRDNYQFDYGNAILYLKKDVPDTLVITYRVFPFKKSTVISRFNYDSIRYNFALEKPVRIEGIQREEKLIDFGQINYNGSIGRGISFGNNQDAVVSSTLNLQLNGFIGDSLEFTAAISDNNIPIQPEGNTQNIQDFDKIFMQIKKKGWQINFGDIDLRQNQNKFLNFYKRLQGASFLTENKFGKGNTNTVTASGAIARGKFTRNVINPLEGNQGPYKLYGTNGELYFAVLAGTEKVFIDGQLMERGADRDYIIDYNTAELTFTAHRMITKDSRIQVEFEYSDRNYLNSMLYLSDQVKLKDKWDLNIALYSNTDAKNSPINQTLTDAQKRFLTSIGNNIDSAYYPDVFPDTFSVNKILYQRVDTTVNGLKDSIYVFSADKNQVLYNVSFTNVGQGKGNYISVSGNANGRVFQWIAPVNGKPQGDWEPVMFLVTPKKHQVISAVAKYNLNQKTSFRISGAWSDYDVNTFSDIGNGDNHGLAWSVGVQDRRALSGDSIKGWVLNTNLNYENVNHQYKSPETLRPVEFYREWGLSMLMPSADEKLITAGIGVNRKNNFIRYELTNYKRDQEFSGYRNAVITFFEKNGWRLDNSLYYTKASDTGFTVNYWKPSFSISKKISSLKNYRISTSYLSEINRQLMTRYDTLSPVSFGYSRWEISIASDAAKPARWGLSYFVRTNLLPLRSELKTSDKSENVSLMAELSGNEKRQLKVNMTYRQLKVADDFFTTQKNDKSLLGRIDYLFNEWKGAASGMIYYELGAGQEQKREYTYLEVPAGQGVYTWIDYNGDGIPQLNEFELAVFQDQKRWIRVLTPTNQYLKANYVQFNYNFSLNPQRWKSLRRSGFKKFLDRFNATSALQVNRKQISSGSFMFNPFGQNFNDSNLISLNSFLSNSLYFNRANPVFGFDITHRLNNNKAVLNYGFESNSLSDLGIRTRWNVNRSIACNITSNLRKRKLSVPAFQDRNYEVNEWEVQPAVSYIYKTDFRATLQYGYNQKRNEMGTGEKAGSHTLTTEVRYNVFSSGVINGRFSLNNIDFTGNANSPVGFLMLDGLMPGKNLLWNLELTKRLAGNIELSLQYEGRKPSEHVAVHTGRASLRAIF